MKWLTLFFVVCVILVTPVLSQQPGIQDSSVFKAMAKIKPLSGEWSGKGWIQMGREK